MTNDTLISMILEPHSLDLGGMQVHRVLPAARLRAVGPYVFLDQIGPGAFGPGQGLDIRPHPHIGLSTLTWLLEGQIMHRDSLGYAQAIRPGEVNLMTAGKGIVHSERTPQELRAQTTPLFGVQVWLALPKGQEEMEPAFEHHPAAALPVIDLPGGRVILVLGEGWGRASPVTVHAPAFYADIMVNPGAGVVLPALAAERALHILSGTVTVNGQNFSSGRSLVLAAGPEPEISSPDGARLVFLGGPPLPEPRYMWWNYVSTSRERIERALIDWEQGKFPEVPGEEEFIPAPNR